MGVRLFGEDSPKPAPVGASPYAAFASSPKGEGACAGFNPGEAAIGEAAIGEAAMGEAAMGEMSTSGGEPIG